MLNNEIMALHLKQACGSMVFNDTCNTVKLYCAYSVKMIMQIKNNTIKSKYK